ncbi:rod shape-determining protein MreC [Fodinicurvata fenggangensis]|uniref:rod shape-determining protein MreC n=1 Tax=Fodinicurvata fenggangensis TaxID=1121830 RepID=UPI00068FEFB3|nr:rod shape-determining protein MreC [Fodinicurvata fenggangensis]
MTRIATPLKAWAQRFSFLLIIGMTFALMVMGSTDNRLVETLRTQVVDITTPVLETLAKPVNTVEQLITNVREIAELRQINADLRAENERLMAWHHRAQQLEAENAALRNLLNLVPEPGMRFVTARVVGDSGGAFVRSVLIAAGETAGVSRGQAALAGQGLVGSVVEVAEESARILLLTDLNSRIPVAVGSNRKKAVLAGDNSPEPSLRYLAPDEEVRVGEAIMTSGDGGVFPSGLPVGVISQVDDTGARVRLYADWRDPEFLRLVDYELPGLIAPLVEGQDQTAVN